MKHGNRTDTAQPPRRVDSIRDGRASSRAAARDDLRVLRDTRVESPARRSVRSPYHSALHQGRRPRAELLPPPSATSRDRPALPARRSAPRPQQQRREHPPSDQDGSRRRQVRLHRRVTEWHRPVRSRLAHLERRHVLRVRAGEARERRPPRFRSTAPESRSPDSRPAECWRCARRATAHRSPRCT